MSEEQKLNEGYYDKDLLMAENYNKDIQAVFSGDMSVKDFFNNPDTAINVRMMMAAPDMCRFVVVTYKMLKANADSGMREIERVLIIDEARQIAKYIVGDDETIFRHNAERERDARLIDAAPEMYDFVKIVYKLLTEDDESGEGTMNWHMTCDFARQILDRIDGEVNGNG